MSYKAEKFTPSTSHYKILLTVSLLNEKGYYPLSEGIGKILKGEDDEEVEQFKDFPTYKTLISYNSKKISRYIMMLYRYHYLDKVYDPKTDKLYIKISTLGETSLLKYTKKYKTNFIKKKKVKTPTIVKIQ